MLPEQNLKILLALESFQNLTGSEMYVYETARELLARGHQVHIAAERTGDSEIVQRITKKGAVVWKSLERAQHCALHHRYDVIHTAQPGPTIWALKHFAQPIVCTIHSQLSMEQPVIDDRIKMYICVRPEILAKLIVVDGIPTSKLTTIYNPIDVQRFADMPFNDASTLFCGTIDNIRKHTIKTLIETEHALILVGDKNQTYDGYIETLPAHVEWHPSTWDVEQYLARCTETASVFIGRTAMEGWAADRSCYVFNIDGEGNVLGRQLMHKPAWFPLCDSKIVADQILDVYSRVYR